MFEVGKSKRKWTCSRISSTRRARTRGCHCPIPPHHQRSTVRWIPSQTKQKFRVGLQRIKDEVRGLIVTLGLVETEILFKYPRGVCNLSSPEREERGHVAGVCAERDAWPCSSSLRHSQTCRDGERKTRQPRRRRREKRSKGDPRHASCLEDVFRRVGRRGGGVAVRLAAPTVDAMR